VARTRRPSDAQAQVHFEHTQVDWRDDNRHLWQFIEDGDEEDTAPNPTRLADEELHSLPPQLYPEWDYLAGSDRPDWVRVFEYLHPPGHADDIDQLLLRHAALSKRLQRLLDQLKPQGRTRERHLENGSELDLDVALATLWRLAVFIPTPDTMCATCTSKVLKSRGQTLSRPDWLRWSPLTPPAWAWPFAMPHEP
jgi:hypothetical protein